SAPESPTIAGGDGSPPRSSRRTTSPFSMQSSENSGSHSRREPTDSAFPKLTTQRIPERSRTPMTAPTAGIAKQAFANAFITASGEIGRAPTGADGLIGSEDSRGNPGCDIGDLREAQKLADAAQHNG